MSKKIYWGLTLAAILILSFILILDIRQPKVSNNVVLTQIPTSLATQPSLASLSTIETERTALAIFTQNPTLALSSTPFYAQIIYDDVIRNLTEVPLPSRPCYVNPTHVPLNSATLVNECGPFIATMMLADEPRKIMALMEKAGIQGTAGIESYGLEGINHSDNQSFVAVKSRIGIQVTLDTITDQQVINDTVTSLVDILMQKWQLSRQVSNNADISIVLSDGSQNKSILTTYTILNEVYKKELKGETLIEALGGLTESKPKS